MAAPTVSSHGSVPGFVSPVSDRVSPVRKFFNLSLGRSKFRSSLPRFLPKHGWSPQTTSAMRNVPMDGRPHYVGGCFKHGRPFLRGGMDLVRTAGLFGNHAGRHRSSPRSRAGSSARSVARRKRRGNPSCIRLSRTLPLSCLSRFFIRGSGSCRISLPRCPKRGCACAVERQAPAGPRRAMA